MSKLDQNIEILWKGEFLVENEVFDLCNKSKEIFIEEGNI